MRNVSARLSGIALVVVLATLMPVSASAAGLPGLPSGTGHGSPFVVRPAQIVYTGDGSGVLGGFSGRGPLPRFGRLKWSSWTRGQALGSGAVWLDNCTPSCAQGSFRPYAVAVHAFDPRAGHFTRLTLRYSYEGKQVIDRRGVEKVGSNFMYVILGTT
jgi:hypothetical protein